MKNNLINKKGQDYRGLGCMMGPGNYLQCDFSYLMLN